MVRNHDDDAASGGSAAVAAVGDNDDADEEDDEDDADEDDADDDDDEDEDLEDADEAVRRGGPVRDCICDSPCRHDGAAPLGSNQLSVLLAASSASLSLSLLSTGRARCNVRPLRSPPAPLLCWFR